MTPSFMNLQSFPDLDSPKSNPSMILTGVGDEVKETNPVKNAIAILNLHIDFKLKPVAKLELTFIMNVCSFAVY